MTNKHKGNSGTLVKYAAHANTMQKLNKSVNILEDLGFVIRLDERGIPPHHVILDQPKWMKPDKSFQYIIIVQEDGNAQRINPTSSRQGCHVGLRISSSRVLRKLADKFSTKNTACILLINKPDELSMFIQLPCGEVLEISGKHDKSKNLK